MHVIYRTHISGFVSYLYNEEIIHGSHTVLSVLTFSEEYNLLISYDMHAFYLLIFFSKQSEIPLSFDGIIYFSQSRWTSESYTYGKQRICLSDSWSAHFYVSWLSDLIFYLKPLYKLLHQSFFYSFITILPSESGVTLHYSTILPQIL